MTKTALKTGVAMLCIAFVMGCQRAPIRQARFNCPPQVTPVTVLMDSNPYPVRVQPDCVNANNPVPVVHITIWNVEDPHLESSVLLQYPSDPQGNQHQRQGPSSPTRALLPNPTPYPKSSTYVDLRRAAISDRP